MSPRARLLLGLALLSGITLFLGIAPAESVVSLTILWALFCPRCETSSFPRLLPPLLLYFGVQALSVLLSENPTRSFVCFRGDLAVLFLPFLLSLIHI